MGEAAVEEDDLVEGVHGPVGGGDFSDGADGVGHDFDGPPATAEGGEDVGCQDGETDNDLFLAED